MTLIEYYVICLIKCFEVLEICEITWQSNKDKDKEHLINLSLLQLNKLVKLTTGDFASE